MPTFTPTIPPPLNNDCANATVITTGTTIFSSLGATTDDPAACGSIGSDIWYRFTAPCTGGATVDLCGSSYDTVITVYNGICCPPQSSYLACNDDFCGVQSQLTFDTVQGNSYLVRIGGYQANQGSGTITLSCSQYTPTPTKTPTCPVVSGPALWVTNATDTSVNLAWTRFDGQPATFLSYRLYRTDSVSDVPTLSLPSLFVLLLLLGMIIVFSFYQKRQLIFFFGVICLIVGIAGIAATEQSRGATLIYESFNIDGNSYYDSGLAHDLFHFYTLEVRNNCGEMAGYGMYRVDLRNPPPTATMTPTGQATATRTQTPQMTMTPTTTATFTATAACPSPPTPTKTITPTPTTVPGSNCQLGTWATATSLNQGRSQHAAAIYAAETANNHGYIYVVGGYNSSYLSIASVEQAAILPDYSLGNWVNSGVTLPTAMHNLTAVIHNGYLYVLGGFDGTVVSSSVLRASITAGTLSPFSVLSSQMTTPRHNGQAVVSGDFIYYLVGQDVETAHILPNGDLGAFSLVSSLQNNRFVLSVVGIGNHLYAIGGTPNGATSYSTVEMATVTSPGVLSSWTSVTAMQEARYGAAAIAYGNAILILGGYRSPTVLQTVEITESNPSTGALTAWQYRTSLPQPRYGQSAVSLGPNIYLVGGDSSGPAATQTVYWNSLTCP